MKRSTLLIAALILAGCNRAPDAPAPAAEAPAPAPATTEPAQPPAPAPAEIKRGSATGVVQSIDAAAKTITIAHGPVEALGWPGMTMTFQAPNTDLSTIKAGDNVDFEFDSTGADGTIVSITKR
jgi:Cu(I)/Ag(I) efflux system protein CusF